MAKLSSSLELVSADTPIVGYEPSSSEKVNQERSRVAYEICDILVSTPAHPSYPDFADPSLVYSNGNPLPAFMSDAGKLTHAQFTIMAMVTMRDKGIRPSEKAAVVPQEASDEQAVLAFGVSCLLSNKAAEGQVDTWLTVTPTIRKARFGSKYQNHMDNLDSGWYKEQKSIKANINNITATVMGIMVLGNWAKWSDANPDRWPIFK